MSYDLKITNKSVLCWVKICSYIIAELYAKIPLGPLTFFLTRTFLWGAVHTPIYILKCLTWFTESKAAKTLARTERSYPFLFLFICSIFQQWTKVKRLQKINDIILLLLLVYRNTWFSFTSLNSTTTCLESSTKKYRSHLCKSLQFIFKFKHFMLGIIITEIQYRSRNKCLGQSTYIINTHNASSWCTASANFFCCYGICQVI